MKYKVGDRVKVKSIDWYNENKDAYGYVRCIDSLFTPEHSKYCGCEFTISHITEFQIPSYVMESNGHEWTDEMIECKVKEENKPKFKIGDKVKWCNYTCDITSIYTNENTYTYLIMCDDYRDDKILVKWVPESELIFEDDEITKSEPKFKVGDKITNGKATLTILTLTTNSYVVEDNFGECGSLYFNTQDVWKLVEEENNDCKKCSLTRNSTRCLFMDNCPHNKDKNIVEIPKDYVIKDENNNVINTNKIVLEKKRYKTVDEVVEWLRGCDITKYISVLYSGTCSIRFDTEGLITDFLRRWKTMNSEFKLGDIFHQKYSRDTVPIKVVSIAYKSGLIEPEYTLKSIRYNGDEIILGESALKELYWKIK